MPIQNLEMPKAPKGWQPTSDQRQQVARDSRLQRLSNDELYFYFNKPKTGNATKPARQGSENRAPESRSGGGSSGGVFGWVDQVKKALGGN